ncbi:MULTISPECIES: HypC/HybG/HupF family hydrogenase formation chaperone [Olsenella]|uniref:HypC/HybG/HupF family hydrogenase formation chaperone n=1 Tax=Olsenella TaxID=133925 RepID=UPI00071DA188|nr:MULTISPECIES: HypC/HybG/HupF family hydrogenase formation chaperone [Olsenella]OFK24806.1 hydrogenase assembly protein HypC [Olsenella sp. HMSC062G07]
MCVGLPARVIRVSAAGTALVEATGARREVSAQLLEGLEPGEYVMVHAGSAIARITDDDDAETGDLERELL